MAAVWASLGFTTPRDVSSELQPQQGSTPNGQHITGTDTTLTQFTTRHVQVLTGGAAMSVLRSSCSLVCTQHLRQSLASHWAPRTPSYHHKIPSMNIATVPLNRNWPRSNPAKPGPTPHPTRYPCSCQVSTAHTTAASWRPKQHLARALACPPNHTLPPKHGAAPLTTPYRMPIACKESEKGTA